MIQNFVGGYAGSGTRTIQLILQQAGVYVGYPTDIAETFDEKYTQQLFTLLSIAYKNKFFIDDNIKNELKSCVNRFIGGSDATDWSIKNGETMWCIPLLKESFPNSTYILFVRNGLDNILTQILFAEAYTCNFLSDKELSSLTDFWEKRMLLWNKVTQIALKDGEKYYENKFLVVRLEDLINNRRHWVKLICDHVGATFNEKCLSVIRDPGTIDRHKKQWIDEKLGGHVYDPDKYIEKLTKIGYESLKELNYL